jgi:hypothetical protein
MRGGSIVAAHRHFPPKSHFLQIFLQEPRHLPTDPLMQLERVCCNQSSWRVCVGISASSAHHLEILMAFSTVRIEFACSTAQTQTQHTHTQRQEQAVRSGACKQLKASYISSLTQGPQTQAAQRKASYTSRR